MDDLTSDWTYMDEEHLMHCKCRALVPNFPEDGSWLCACGASYTKKMTGAGYICSDNPGHALAEWEYTIDVPDGWKKPGDLP